MDFKTKWKYTQTINKALKGTNYDAMNFLIVVLVIAIPVGLIANWEMPGTVFGFLLLPFPVLYFMTFYRWHLENKSRMRGFGPSTSVTVGGGMLGISDGKNRVELPIEDIRELAVFVPEKVSGPPYWWIVVLENLEYMLPEDAQGLENLLREFRDDPVFDSDPVDREDAKPGRWTVWDKEGSG